MERVWIYIVFFLLILGSCSQPQTDPNTVINGSFAALSGSWIVLEELEPQRTKLLDSTLVDASGNFSFHFYSSEPGFFILVDKNKNTLVLQIDPEQEVEVSGPGSFIEGQISVSGSPGSQYILDFDQFLSTQRERVDSLGNVYQLVRGDDDFDKKKKSLDSVYRSLVQTHRTYVKKFINDHPTSLVNLLMINRRMGSAVVFDEKEDFPIFYKVDSLLQVHHPGNKHSRDHHERVQLQRGEIFDDYVIEEKLRPGKRAPDVVLPDTSGNPVSLKSYAGKTVVLYFWAGWDAQSRKDNRVLKSAYPTLRDRGIEILGISLDENEVVWKGAVRLDELSWPQVSELKGFYAQIKKEYHIPDKLPFYYLISPDQRIQYKHENLDSILVRLN
jgi:peroxiredoxin